MRLSQRPRDTRDHVLASFRRCPSSCPAPIAARPRCRVSVACAAGMTTAAYCTRPAGSWHDYCSMLHQARPQPARAPWTIPSFLVPGEPKATARAQAQPQAKPDLGRRREGGREGKGKAQGKHGEPQTRDPGVLYLTTHRPRAPTARHSLLLLLLSPCRTARPGLPSASPDHTIVPSPVDRGPEGCIHETPRLVTPHSTRPPKLARAHAFTTASPARAPPPRQATTRRRHTQSTNRTNDSPNKSNFSTFLTPTSPPTMAQEPEPQPERSMHARVGRDNQRYTQRPLHSPNPQTAH